MAGPLDDLITDEDLGEARRPYAAVVRKTLGRDRRGNVILEDRNDMRLRRQGFSADEIDFANMPVAQRAAFEMSNRRQELDERQFQMQVRRQEFEELTAAYEAGVKQFDLQNANEQRAAQVAVLEAMGKIDVRAPGSLEQIEALKAAYPTAFTGVEGEKLDARLKGSRDIAEHYRTQLEALTATPDIDPNAVLKEAMDDSGNIDYLTLRFALTRAQQNAAAAKREAEISKAIEQNMVPVGITVGDKAEVSTRLEAPDEPATRGQRVKKVSDEMTAEFGISYADFKNKSKRGDVVDGVFKESETGSIFRTAIGDSTSDGVDIPVERALALEAEAGGTPVLNSKEEFDALPSGAEYLRDGKRYRKP